MKEFPMARGMHRGPGVPASIANIRSQNAVIRRYWSVSRCLLGGGRAEQGEGRVARTRGQPCGAWMLATYVRYMVWQLDPRRSGLDLREVQRRRPRSLRIQLSAI